jgi:hypothetical protein
MAEQVTPGERNKATNALLLSILASIAGGLLTNALTSSSTARVIGTILGAAVPQLITHIGPGHRLRATLAFGVTGVALFVAYGGFAVFAFASDEPSVVPLPSILPNPAPSVDGPAVDVSPRLVDCGAFAAGAVGAPFECDTVTVESRGSKPLRNIWVEFSPRGQGFSQNETCKGRSLSDGETCTVTVSFEPAGESGVRSSEMIVHENVPTDNGIHVTVRGAVTALKPVGDLVVSPSVRCDYVAGVEVGGATVDAIRIWLTVELEDVVGDAAPTQVPLSGSNDTLQAGTAALPETRRDDFPIGSEEALTIPLQPDMYDKEHTLTLAVDPDQQVPEIDDGNNALMMKLVLPAQPQAGNAVQCESI